MSGLEKPRVYVSALVCGDVIREAPLHGGPLMLTLVRVSQGFAADPSETISFYVVSTFTAEQPCSFRFLLRVVAPNGVQVTCVTHDYKIGQGADGATLSSKVAIPATIGGDYWFELLVDDEVATKIPLRILHALPDFSPEQE